MLSITVRNVNHALPLAMLHLRESGKVVAPRGMPTLEYPTPVCTTYLEPHERVLFCPERDANPFFHLFESLWILAGRQDVAWLAQFNSNIANYSDDGVKFHAAYGWRLRRHFGFDQLASIISQLRDDPDTRRAVLQIWDCQSDLNTVTKDTPCNDLVFFKLRHGRLNMTVCNRSNDVIWGAYGANVVQFSMLQEYLAARLGVRIGVYRQISDSFHVYTDNPQWEKLRALSPVVIDQYEAEIAHPLRLATDIAEWDHELYVFMRAAYAAPDGIEVHTFTEPFFELIAKPMLMAWRSWKRTKDALEALKEPIGDSYDWHVAARKWLYRRAKP